MGEKMYFFNVKFRFSSSKPRLGPRIQNTNEIMSFQFHYVRVFLLYLFIKKLITQHGHGQSKKNKPPTTTALKCKQPLSTRIKIPPFGPYFMKFSKTVFYELNLALQSSDLEALVLSKFWSEKRGF